MTDDQTITNNEESAATESPAPRKSDSENTAPAILKSAAEYASITPGMTVRVHQKIKDVNKKGEEKERIQVYEGLVIARNHGKQIGATITVRKVTEGIAVEKIFPLNSPTITHIETIRNARVRRSKLYFVRTNQRKKMKEKAITVTA